MKKIKVTTKIKKVRKGRKIAKVKRVKGKPKLDPSKITVSKIELIFEAFLRHMGIKVKPQHQIGYKFYDFIIEDTKILLEFDGDYWHCNPSKFPTGPTDNNQKKNIKNDKFKNVLAASNGYTLIRIWESDFKEQPNVVAERIKKVLKEHNDKSSK